MKESVVYVYPIKPKNTLAAVKEIQKLDEKFDKI